jgi:hypothetical protein
LKKNNKDKDKFDRQQRRVTAPIVAPLATVAHVKTGKFALLEDDDDDIELTTTTIDNFPSISTTTSVTPVVTWASMAAAVAHIPQPKPKITAITTTVQNDDESVDDEYDDDKIAIGDQLYYRIIDNYPSHAADVVGMLLDLDEHQLSILLQDEHELNRRVVHCISLLQPSYQQHQLAAVADDDW